MLENDYQFSLLLFRKDGSPLGSASVNVDWEPAVEATRFLHARHGLVPFCGEGTAYLQPLWDKLEGEPHIRGFRVIFEARGSRPVSSEFPSRYFREAAAQASDEFVKRGKLEAGETYLYQAVAHRNNGAVPANGAGFLLEAVEQAPAVSLSQSCLKDVQSRSAPVGVIDADDMPVFIPRRILDEVVTLTMQTEHQETGGILIGHLRRDMALPEIFAEATAQIAAEHTRSSATKLTFTAESWNAATAAIRLRKRSEIFLGYWHSHPVKDWCASRECSLEKQKQCRLAKDFFSEDDCAVMRAAFPRAYSLGLVANNTATEGVTFSLFGWREGGIHARGFHVLEETHA